MHRTTRHLAVLAVPLLLVTGCAADDGGSVSTIGDSSGSASGSASGSGSASASASGMVSEEESAAFGGFSPVSDVDAHAKVSLDVCDINDLLPGDGSEIDWAGITTIYEEGGNSPSGDEFRTLAGNATADRDEPLWNLYAERLGPNWLDSLTRAALDGTQLLDGEDDLVRRQVAQKTIKDANLVAWAFHELDAARAEIEVGELDPASGAPLKVDEIWAFQHGEEPGCAPYGTAISRGEDFGTGTAAADRALAAVEDLQQAAIDGDLEAYDAAYDEYVTATAIPYLQATIKYAQNVSDDLAADDAEAARLHVSDQLVELLLEDARDEVGAVARVLSRRQLAEDLLPLRVARHRDEERRLPKLPHRRHPVVVPLGHVARPVGVARRQHDTLPRHQLFARRPVVRVAGVGERQEANRTLTEASYGHMV